MSGKVYYRCACSDDAQTACSPNGCTHFPPEAYALPSGFPPDGFSGDPDVDPDVDLCQHCRTPVCVGCRISLARAVQNGSLAECQRMLQSGIDPNYPQGPRGRSPLHEAAALGYCRIIHSLVDAQADVNLPTPHDRWTPLHEATQQANQEAVMALLERSANPALKCSVGHTALDIARLQERVADIWH